MNDPIRSEQDLFLRDEPELLELMVIDSLDQDPIYKPGPYWQEKTRESVKQIRRHGIGGFRGIGSLIGNSCSDNLHVDVRIAGQRKLDRLAKALMEMPKLRRIFDAQVELSRGYALRCVNLLNLALERTPRTRDLLDRYMVPFSLLGECATKVMIDGREYAIHYLNLLDQHDAAAEHVDFRSIRSMYEVGGGFGANVHLLLENYSNVRKVLYLDIPPNLYLGTQYLRAFYGSSVRDYQELKNVNRIRFRDDDTREIMCIPPWLIERFESRVDLFTNSHSFVEMPDAIVSNYVKKFEALPDADHAAIVLVSYDGGDFSKTLDPSQLPTYFKAENFCNFKRASLVSANRWNGFHVLHGKFPSSPRTPCG